MPAFVSDCDCDLLISSARADATGSAEQVHIAVAWARDLGKGLQSLLAQKLGRRDWGVVMGPSIPAGQHSPMLLERSAAFLVVLTREYLADRSSLDDLETFVSAIGGGDPTNRIFVVLADDVPREMWPEPLRNHLAYDFRAQDDSADSSKRRLDVSDKGYPVRLDDLSAEIAICLERLKSEREGKQRAGSPPVYLAKASPDAEELRDSVRRYLIQEGFRILPNRWYPQNSVSYSAASLCDMRDCHLMVQLLGVESVPALPGGNLGIGSLEISAAREAGLPIMCWRDPRLEISSISDPEHIELIENEYVLAVSIEEFKRKIVERAHQHVNKPTTTTDKPLVVVAASAVDRSLAQHVGQLLDGKGLSIEISDTEDVSWDRYSNGSLRVGGLLIVYGACPAIWVRQQLWKYRKAMARIESRPPLCAVCEGPPEAKEPLRYEVPQMDTIDCRMQVTEAALSSFVDAVQRRCSQ
jgi:hypothetical protein